MAYDEKLAIRVRHALAGRRSVVEKKMFGGLAFMWRGNMCCGVLKDDLIVRVHPDATPKALKKPHAKPFTFTGKPMRGFIVVAPAGCKTAAAVRRWVDIATEFSASLPVK
ncbi:MAG: TfoX/Sxy family protein [Rhodospirillales bacterium]|nr:TfoX/Sxy family protein [Rhodospirillales bacterium]